MARIDTNDYKQVGLALGAGFVLGCHLGTYFLSGVVLLVMVVVIVTQAT